MKKIVLKLAIIAIIVSVGLIAILSIREETKDYARITALDYKAEVVDEENSFGKVVITERLTFDIHAASENNLFWELWRVLAEEYVDGVKVDYNVLYVKQLFDDGTSLVLEESPQLYWYDNDYINTEGGLGPNKWFHSKGPYDDYMNFESLMIYVDGLYREQVVYEIQYEMFNASLRYHDSSELYISLFYGDEIKYLESLSAQILIPIEKMPQEGNYMAHTFGSDAHSFPFEESLTLNPGYHTFAFDLDETELSFRPYNNYIEFSLVSYGEDRYKFTQHASINDYYDIDVLDNINLQLANYEKLATDASRNKIVTLVICGVLGLLSLGSVHWIYTSFKRKYKLYSPTLEIDYFRDIPSDLDANFARKLVFSKQSEISDKGDGYAAAMLSLAHKGYIEVSPKDMNKNITANNVELTVLMATETRAPLSPVEKLYFDLIARHVKDQKILLSDFQQKLSHDYQYTTSFVSNVKQEINRMGVNEKYFQKVNYRQPQHSLIGIGVTYLIFGLMIMILGNGVSYQTRLDFAHGAFFILGGCLIIGAIFLLTQSSKFLLLTQFGEDEYAKWRGLYSFLNNETLMVERGLLDLAIWEKYLIYATAFGISEKVIKAIKISVPDEVVMTSPILYNRVFRSQSFYRSSRSTFSTATRSATFNASRGGHGGYGGGGRGGGGGGGGH